MTTTAVSPRTSEFPAPPVEVEFREAPPRHARDYLWVLSKYRWLAAGCFGLTVGITVLVVLLTPRQYTALTRLQFTRQSPIQLRLDSNVLRVGDADDAAAGTAFLATQMTALQSRDLAERVIRGHQLDSNAAFLHPAGEHARALLTGSRLTAVVRPRGWPASLARTPEEEAPSSAPFDPDLVDRYLGWLTVRDVHGTDVVEVGFMTPDPALSAFLASAHVNAFVEANEEARRSNDVTAREFLSKQLRESEERLERVDAVLRRFAAEHPNVAIDQEQQNIAQRINEVSSLLTKAEATRLALESRYEYLSRPGTDLLPYFLDRPNIQKLHLALLDLRAEAAARGQRLGRRHPEMLERDRQEREVRRQLDAQLGDELAAIHTHFNAAKEREDALSRKLAHLETSAIELRDLGARYELLKNDVATARALHESLLRQQTDTAVNSELAASNVRVLERPEIPARPSRPNVALDLVFGVLAGLVFGAAAAFGCEYFDNSVKSSEEIETFLQLPTLATIPNFGVARQLPAERALAKGNGSANGGGADGGDELVVVREPWSRIAEAFRSMRTAVLFSVAGTPPRVIAVTSTVAAEGKTVGSLNLAATLAEAGSRVVLVDADLRHPRSHRALGLEAGPGLAAVLAGEAAIDDVVRPAGTSRFAFVAAGVMPPNPAELAGSLAMQQVLAALRERYEFVIIDTPPVLPVTDAVVIGRAADAVLLVVKGHDTPRELVRRARDRLVSAGAHVLGVVVNNVGLGWDDLYLYNPYHSFGRGTAEAQP